MAMLSYVLVGTADVEVQARQAHVVGARMTYVGLLCARCTERRLCLGITCPVTFLEGARSPGMLSVFVSKICCSCFGRWES